MSQVVHCKWPKLCTPLNCTSWPVPKCQSDPCARARRLMASGRLEAPSVSVPGYVPAKRKASVPYRQCGVRDPAEKHSKTSLPFSLRIARARHRVAPTRALSLKFPLTAAPNFTAVPLVKITKQIFRISDLIPIKLNFSKLALAYVVWVVISVIFEYDWPNP